MIQKLHVAEILVSQGRMVKEATKQIGLLQTKALRWHSAQPGTVVRNGCRGPQNPPKLDRKAKRELRNQTNREVKDIRLPDY
jgi:hypothetical protein